MKPELVIDAKADLGEGPVWHDGVLSWVNIIAGEVHRYDPRTGESDTRNVGQAVGALVPRYGGGLVLALRDGFAALPSMDGALDWLVEVEADNTANRMNDGKCDRAGRFWASTMAFEATADAGALYRLDPDLSVRKVLDGLTIGNGLAWSADDRRFYFIDSMSGGVDVMDFDPDTGAVTNRRQLVKIPSSDGIPDGMTIDDDGCLWVALWGGGAVRRYTPEGQLDQVIELPAPNVTACTFGGDDLGDLYITTARQTMTDGDLAAQPQAGGVFRVRPGVTGAPAFGFAG